MTDATVPADEPGFPGLAPAPAPAANQPAGYRVLARKYRPAHFGDLIGQDAMVRTLTNAFAAGRIPQAWMLTGVRGVGKTTTARILARALNYQNADGTGAPTTDLSRFGVHCQAIVEGRHIDVMEIDAASNNGVDNVRQINDAVRYAPTSARYKVYIIDEVHMLSGGAFNAFLKTLEEPPPHAKFIFATTEIRKVPVTVLSRCQRFDLRRVDAGVLVGHLAGICKAEGIEAEEEALAAISRAAEGSVRDSLSILDQAIAHAGGKITLEEVRTMLGLSDRARVIDLFEQVMKGDIAAALGELRAQYDAGADPAVVLSDLAEFSHLVTRLKLVPDAVKDNSLSQAERTRGADFAERLSIRVLARAWQMLLKAIAEVRQADRPVMAAEMALVRLAHAADLPTPDEALRMLRDGSGSVSGNGSPAPRPPSGGGATALAARPVLAAANPAPAVAAAPRAMANGLPQPQSLEDLVALASRQRDITMKLALERDVRLVKFEPGRIEFALANASNRHFATDLSKRLKDWTGQTWLVALANTEGAPTLREQAEAARDKRESDAANHPVVRAVLEHFPGARIVDVRDPRAAEAEQAPSATAGDDYLPEAEPLFDDSEPDFEGVEFWTDN
ncbi:DNA polymerase III subunit gamma/tau [Bosea sp. (in: a-proteobacteria)]|uniref:DNA polymerase III subunit gamma/tau n=1 Tax=Bosea sp. (in: a-proteobacteria) TaxID=1871050 RepID=UPI0008690660|nr:DNA polymerase III subunit gamma/tau [Bosea sp. (in: a-proteobacteria)]MBN9435650.1 DNA polymerase III subunit gamma/tau [Bosea sp. (in: a-proteobacteria)]MBN9448032.1 DNA polymerase III subunit gamma/tau [Bosea sp. (in: a-proteobacteria)]ODT53949.1 MAG: DNA polymerase III subunit gamma/tau [Methylobacterium sp. SCN 67-24]